MADYSFTPIEYWRGVSLAARGFIKQCLTIDPTKRMTAHAALSHEWIAGPESGRGEEDLLPVVKKNFNARRTLHKAIDTVRAINQLRAGGMGMMDGAQSTNPQRTDAKNMNMKAPEELQPESEDVDMQDAAPNGGDPEDALMSMDPRGHGRGADGCAD